MALSEDRLRWHTEREKMHRAEAAAKGTDSILAALRRSDNLDFALVDREGRVLDRNLNFSRSLDFTGDRDFILGRLDHPLASKLKDAVERSAVQAARQSLTWEEERSWKEYEVIALDEDTILVLGMVGASRSCLLAGEEREEFYSKLFLDSQTPMLIIEPSSGRIADANRAAVRFYGYDRDALTSMNIAQLNILSDPNIRKNIQSAMARSGETFFFRHRLATGEIRNVEVHSGPIHIGRDEYLYSIIHDITDRKRAEQVARESEQRYRALSDSSLEGVVIHSEGRILDCNKAFADMMAMTVSQLIGRTFKEIVDRGSVSVIMRCTELDYREPYDLAITRFDGKRLTLEVRGQPTRFKGQAARVAAVRDITERKQMEERLREERARLRAILDSLPVGVFIADSSGRIVETNPLVEKIWGGVVPVTNGVRDYESYVGYWADTGRKVRPEEWALTRAIVERERIIGDVIDIERMDGSMGTILNSASPVVGPGGDFMGAVVILQDITRQRQMEREAHQDKARAELYLDLLTHDINNSNSVALGYLQMLKDRESLEPRSEDLLDRSLEALRDSSELIDTIGKVQRAGVEARSPLDLGEVLRGVVADYRNYPRKEVEIDLECECDVPVWANPLIKEVFTNLMDNAVKHAPGPVKIWIRAAQVGSRYEVTVEDNGPGIPDEVKGRLFSRFKRGSTTAPGHGLGLFLARSLIESYGGSVSIEDRVPGDHSQGARFVVILPISPPRTG